jgi:hypothetical protein
LANRTQIGFPIFAEALEFVQGAVKSALEAAFLAVEQGQRVFAPTCGATGISVKWLIILLKKF